MAQRLTMDQLAILQNLEKSKQERRIEDLRILMSAGAWETVDLMKSGYTAKEIKFIEENFGGINMRNLEKRNLNTTGVDRGLSHLGKEITSGYTLQETIISRINNNKMLSQCLNKVCASNTGISVFPIVSDTNISYIECRAEEIEKQFVTSEALVLATPDFETKIKTMLDLSVTKEVESKVATVLNTVTSTGVTLEDLVSNIDNKYIDSLYIMCNELDYKKLLKLKDATGKTYVELEKNQDGIIVAKYGDIEIIVNDTMTQIALFNPEFIGISHASTNVLELDMKIVQHVRSGKRLDRLTIGANACILEPKAVSSIKLA